MVIVELLPDPQGEAWVREDWAALEAIDCPNLSRHRSPTNRPHLTVSAHDLPTDPAADDVDRLRARIQPATAGLPLTVPIGPLAVFGDPRSQRGLILVRTLVVTEPLARWRRTVTSLLGSRDADPEPDWVPHLTLARGLTPDQISAALVALPLRGRVGATRSDRFVLSEIRLWDADRRCVLPLDDSADPGGSVPS